LKLSELNNSDRAIIVKVKGRGAFRKRIIEMGFVKGQLITVLKNAPLKDPIEYKIMDYNVSLRRSEAELIEVISETEAQLFNPDFNGVIDENTLKISAKEKGKIITVALVGNPNCGKTTLFNFASNSKESVGNYSGVTVDSKLAEFKQGEYTFKITDLPGTYSLTAYTAEELYVRYHILNDQPDIIINVIDASNLERNLYLTTQLIDMDIKTVVALNMFDELKKSGNKLNFDSLGKMIGIPMIPTISSKGEGIKELFNKVVEVFEDREKSVRHIHINYGKGVEKSITNIQQKIKETPKITDKISSRFISIKLLEKDDHIDKIVKQSANYAEIKEITQQEIAKLENNFKEDSETLITDQKYGFIAGALKETFVKEKLENVSRTDIIDTFLTHKLFGFPLFFFFMWVMFQTTFTIGNYPMEWIDSFVNFMSNVVDKNMPEGMLKDLLVQGVIGGVGGVIIFLPNIIILFFFISLMEDTGYMARAAFIMDKIMHKIGLHGRSFIPLIMGFGCNVPAIMSTRTIESKNDRILTILINPFMSCSARLPVYILITTAFFPENGANIIFGIYIIGILLAALMAIIFKKIFFNKEEIPFVMELPPYRNPTLRVTVKHMWHKASQYLQKMGGIILIASIIIWALGYFPKNTDILTKYENKIEHKTNFYNSKILSEQNLTKKAELQKLKKTELETLLTEMESTKQEKSYIGKIGHFFEPVMQPLGFDWKMTVSLISGIAAKEIVISTMGVLYQANKNDSEATLIHKLQTQKYTSGNNYGKLVFTKLSAISFLIFVLIYFPCIATIAAVKQETGKFSWALFMIFYTTILAWISAFLIYQIGSLFI
jgi:ferrous iron transport protein B